MLQVRKVKFPLILVLIVFFSSGVFAQGTGIPVDIPGTGINFFLYRYEGAKPYEKVNAIWDNLSTVFSQWVETGQDPLALSTKDVQTKSNSSGTVSIYLKEQFIVEVDHYHAKINKATPAQLAQKWADNLKKGVEEFVVVNQPK